MSTHTTPSADTTPEQRARALFAAMQEKNMIPDSFIEEVTNKMEHEWEPANGARIVARAWTDPAFRELLLKDGTAACAQYGYIGPQGEYMVALENTPTLQNVIVCTMCSCTNWQVLGLPPEWYKSFEYRARVVREARTVLREMGEHLPDEVAIQVWDTTAETRYMVLPVRPEGTEHLSEEELAKLITKDVLIGIARPRVPTAA